MGRKTTRKTKHSTKKQKPLLDHNKTGMSKGNESTPIDLKKKVIIKLSDNEDEIDTLLEEFKEDEINFEGSKCHSSVILPSDDEEMENLLEEFIEEETSIHKAKPNHLAEVSENASEEFSKVSVSLEVKSKKKVGKKKKSKGKK